jgi:hypothetical protein
MAAAICHREKLLPADLNQPSRMLRLQRGLMRYGQYIPGLRLDDPDDLARAATVTASSEFALKSLPGDGPLIPLDTHRAQMLPVAKGRMPAVTFFVDVAQSTQMELELRTSNRPDNHTPDVLLSRQSIACEPGKNIPIEVDFDVEIDRTRYVFVCLLKNDNASVRTTNLRVTGLLSASNYGRQDPPPDIGIEPFEFWAPSRRPAGQNLALNLSAPIECYRATNVVNGLARPTAQPNAWVAAPDDKLPTLTLRWNQARIISRIDLAFDTDWDHPMESSLMGHPEDVMPFCVRSYTILDQSGAAVARVEDNHQTRNTIRFAQPVETGALQLKVQSTHGAPAAVFDLRCYGDAEPPL